LRQNQDGIVTTVGRGGSDYTATILGVALEVDEVWIWTDVMVIMTTDPRLFQRPYGYLKLSYQEGSGRWQFSALKPCIPEL